MRYASVCDGIGAAHVAWQPLGWRCQWTSEIEPFPVAVVEHHYGFRNLGDMTKITEEMIDAPVDLLVGGTPCQSFSVAGLRGGLADPRGNLALRFVQLASVMQPRWIVWENVPGVLSSSKGRDFGTFLGALGELGYGFAYRVLDAQWFGVAQRRRRVFVVGYLGDWRRAAAVLFERESVFGNPPTRGKAGQESTGSTGDGLARCVTTGESQRQDWRTCNFIAFHPKQDPISSEDGLTHALNTGSIGGCATAAVAIDGGNQSTSEDIHHTLRIGRDSGNAVASCEVSSTLRSNPGSGWRSNGTPVEGVVITPMAVRRLTPRECERLQGFPDDYMLFTYRGKPAADGPRYRALGNSMAVPVMAWIGQRIAEVEAKYGR